MDGDRATASTRRGADAARLIMPNFRVIEIDVRMQPTTLAARWSAAKRAIFLLDETVTNPLSVDDGIWPNVTKNDADRGVRVARLAEASMPILGTVEDSSDVSDAVEWPLLGYDVADAWQVSGLSNCGYSPEDKAALAEIWRLRLTVGGLIRTLAWAKEFVSVANARVPEHAPFYVYEVRSPDVDRALSVVA